MNLRNINQSNVENLQFNPEAVEYNGCSYIIKNLSIIQREGKLTPKKIGHFVTLWKRDESGVTCPLDASDDLDFLVIICESKNRQGHFFFPKEVLLEKGYLKSKRHDGKRGFRVYPAWDSPSSKQAVKTQKWQLEYFKSGLVLEI